MSGHEQEDSSSAQGGRTAERRSERELVVTRHFDAPIRRVFEAWANPALFRQWWAPRSFGVSMVSIDADIRTGGTYRIVMAHAASGREMTFFGRYVEVIPFSRLIWTNDEGGEDGPVTTVTFEDRDGATLLVMHDLFPSKEALDAAIASGGTSGTAEQFDQLDEMLASDRA